MTDRRRAILLAVLPLSLLIVMLVPPVQQDPAYHQFADQRAAFGIRNFFDVVSNLPFLLVGFRGLGVVSRRAAGAALHAWRVLFAGVLLVSAGSAWYHLSPDNASLVWDRLPMAIGFMGLLVALLTEYVDSRLASWLWPAVLVGAASVGYWALTDDLRFYAWVQFAPLVMLIVLVSMYRAPYTRSWMLLIALFCYALAKITEALDAEIFSWTSFAVSGHTLKHLFAALACAVLARMLVIRTPRPLPESR